MSKDDINNIDEPEDQEKENEELEDEEVDNRQSNGVEDDVTSVWDEDDEDEQSDAKNKKSNSKPKKKDKDEEKKEDKDDDSEEKEKSKDDKKNDEERKQDSKGNNSDDVEKNTNKEYNQEEYLDAFIKKEIPDAKILDDVVIVDGFAFEIDRSVPEIGKYVGKEENLVFPEVSLSKQVADDLKTAMITINAKEETNGISKIEIIQDGHVIKTYTYDHIKEPIEEKYEVKQNGTYVVKVYSALNIKEMIEVDEIVMAVEFSPNGNTEYKKEHEVKLEVNEKVGNVKSIKYQWTDTTAEPEIGTFTEEWKRGELIKKDGLTGQWYLWALVEMENGATRIERSEAFYFDNTGPEVTITSVAESVTSFTLKAIATDNETGIVKYEFYVNDELRETIETNEETVSYTVNDANTGNTNCYVIVTDGLGNETKQTVVGTTKLYKWNTYYAVTTT